MQVQCSGAVVCHDGNTSVRTFRLPPDALWYPLGAQHQGNNILYSVSYSQIESQVLESISPSFSTNGYEMDTSNTSDMSNTEVQKTESTACDMAMFIKNMSLAKGQLQCNGVPSPGQGKSDKLDPSGKPSAEQLSHVFNKLAETVSVAFLSVPDIYQTRFSNILNKFFLFSYSFTFILLHFINLFSVLSSFL